MLILGDFFDGLAEFITFVTLLTATTTTTTTSANSRGKKEVVNLIGDKRYENWSGQKASFGMGCFWGAEAKVDASTGVIRSRVGFAGGSTPNPTYNRPGDHVEAVEIEFDPQLTNFTNLLDVFWDYHDATMRGPRRYQSMIFYHTREQKNVAEAFLQEKRRTNNREKPILTEILPMGIFTNSDEDDQKKILQRHSEIFRGTSEKQKNSQGEFDITRSFVATKLNGYLAGHKTLEDFEKEAESLGVSREHQTDIKNIIREIQGLPLA